MLILTLWVIAFYAETVFGLVHALLFNLNSFEILFSEMMKYWKKKRKKIWNESFWIKVRASERICCEFINEFWIYVWTHKPKNSKFFLFPIFAKSLHTPAFYKWMKISSLEIDLKFFFYYFEIKSELLLPRQSSLSGCIISTVAATLKGQVKGLSSKPSGNCIVVPNFCFLS